MIVSHAHKFIFLKTRKVAGTSMEIALSRYVGPDDIVTPISEEDEALRTSLGYAGPQNCMPNARTGRIDDTKDTFKNQFARKWSVWLPSLARAQSQNNIGNASFDGAVAGDEKFRNHMSAGKVRALLGKRLFKTYLKVSIVRNPYDKTVSAYFWANRNRSRKSREHFREWLLSRVAANKDQKVTHIKNKSIIDFMIRFEHFEKDVTKFAELTGLPTTLYAEFRSLSAKGQNRPKDMTTAFMFDDFPEGRKRIEEVFSEDISKFGYSCPQ